MDLPNLKLDDVLWLITMIIAIRRRNDDCTIIDDQLLLLSLLMSFYSINWCRRLIMSTHWRPIMYPTIGIQCAALKCLLHSTPPTDSILQGSSRQCNVTKLIRRTSVANAWMNDECCTALAQQRKSLNMSQKKLFYRFLHVERKSFPLLFAPFLCICRLRREKNVARN